MKLLYNVELFPYNVYNLGSWNVTSYDWVTEDNSWSCGCIEHSTYVYNWLYRIGLRHSEVDFPQGGRGPPLISCKPRKYPLGNGVNNVSLCFFISLSPPPSCICCTFDYIWIQKRQHLSNFWIQKLTNNWRFMTILYFSLFLMIPVFKSNKQYMNLTYTISNNEISLNHMNFDNLLE